MLSKADDNMWVAIIFFRQLYILERSLAKNELYCSGNSVFDCALYMYLTARRRQTQWTGTIGGHCTSNSRVFLARHMQITILSF